MKASALNLGKEVLRLLTTLSALGQVTIRRRRLGTAAPGWAGSEGLVARGTYGKRRAAVGVNPIVVNGTAGLRVFVAHSTPISGILLLEAPDISRPQCGGSPHQQQPDLPENASRGSAALLERGLTLNAFSMRAIIALLASTVVCAAGTEVGLNPITRVRRGRSLLCHTVAEDIGTNFVL